VTTPEPESPLPANAGPSPSPEARVHSGNGTEISAVILTLNESANIAQCVKSLSWADRVVVFDSFSSDETVQLAEQAGAEVYQARFENYAQQRNAALDAIQTDWVFFVDADERGTEALGEEIRRVVVAAEAGAERRAGYYVPRHNYIFGRLTLGAGWYPDYQLRLFRHGRVRYERPVHELARVDGAIGYLENPLVHHNYRDEAHFHQKQQRYTEYDAGILKGQGVHPRPYTYFTMPLRQFWWRYITLKGHRDGLHGLKLSLYMAYYEWIKYRRLARLWSESGP
jgi:(heptosyl)LPS beta-1,4-glucosyltransferase